LHEDALTQRLADKHDDVTARTRKGQPFTAPAVRPETM
jgi:hypothetical protein